MPDMRCKDILLSFLIALLLFLPVSAAEKVSFSVTDPIGDDHGPGYYVYPQNPVYSKGSFDLTGFKAESSNGIVKFEFSFKNAFMASGGLRSPNGSVLEGEVSNAFYLQNIEVYIDEDHLPGSGEALLLPGRGASAAKESAWEKAILITPNPTLAEKELKRIAPQMSDKVIMPKDYKVEGNTVICEVQTKDIGEITPYWGYIVIVTPADFGGSKKGPMGLSPLGKTNEESLLLRPVKPGAGEWDFGGGDVSGLSPNIIDMIVPSGESQEKTLSGYNIITGSRAVLKAIYPKEGRVSSESSGKDFYSVSATVLAVSNRKITIDKGQRDGMFTGRIGKIFDDDGIEVTEVIVDQVFDSYSVCKIMKVSMISYVSERMKVLFR